MSENIESGLNTEDELLLAVHTTESQREILSSIHFDSRATLAFNESITVTLEGELNVAAFKLAYQEVIKRHSIFHSNFSLDGQYLMVKKKAQPAFELIHIETQSEVSGFEKKVATEAFNLLSGHLIKALLLEENATKHFLILSAHHLVCDGWSWSVLIHDLTKLYNAYKAGSSLELPWPYQYWQYATEIKAQKDKREKSLAFWQAIYEKDIPQTLDFDFAKTRPESRSFESKRIDYDFAPDFVQALKKEARTIGLSFYNYLYASFAIYLAKVTGNFDFALGISAAPQSALGLKDLAGHCVNLLPIRQKFKGNESLLEFYQGSKRSMLEALEAQYCTFGEILRHLPLERDVSKIPLVNVIFNVDQQAPDQGLQFDQIKAKLKTNPRVSENFEMFLNATLCGDHLTLENQFNTDLFSDSDIQDFLSGFEKFLGDILGKTSKTIDTFALRKTVVEKVETPKKLFNASAETKSKLISIWSDLLGHSTINEDSNFFTLGGHSLLASEMRLKIKNVFHKEISLKDIFRAMNLVELAAMIEGEQAAVTVPVLVQKNATSSKTIELSEQQKRAWYVQKLSPDTSVYNLPSFYHYESGIDAKKLQLACAKFVMRHPLIRARLKEESGNLHFEIQDLSEQQITTEIVTLENSDKSLQELFEMAKIDAQKPIKLDSKYFFKCKLYKLKDGSVVSYALIHHLIWDGWCYDIMRKEEEEIYLSLVHNQENPLKGTPLFQYADYVKWQQDFKKSLAYAQGLSFWQDKLRPFTDGQLEVPLDYSRPKSLSFKGDGVLFSWNEEEVRSFESMAREVRSTLYNFMLTAYKVFLMRYSGSTNIVVGTPFQGRSEAGLKDLVGFFVNNMAIASKLNSNGSFKDNLKLVSDSTSEAFSHAEVSFDDVLSALKVKRSLSHTPIYQTFFVYQDATNRKVDFASREFKSLALIRGSVHTDLDFWIRRDSGAMVGGLDFQTDLFKRETIERMCADFRTLLKDIVECHGQKKISELKVMNEDNKAWITETLNETKVEFPNVTLHELIEKSIDRTPKSKTAIKSSDGEMSYAELEEKANQLAHHLRTQGVAAGDLVGVCEPRGKGLLVTLLGIMKAGAGYVPLDPDYPEDRLRYMCEHSKLKIVVCRRSQESLTFLNGLKLIFSDETEAWWKTAPISRIQAKTDPESICYVIYTSGSTGLPKGVTLSHRSVVNFLSSMQKTPGLKESDTLCAVTTLSFDIAVLELYLPLVVGAQVVIATREEALLSDQLEELMRKNGVTAMQATPATWRLLLAAGFKPQAGFKILCGGEPFPKDLAERLLHLTDEVWNMYGPTETTVWSTCKKLKIGDSKITIGRPIDNTQVYILDEQRSPVLFGQTGELYIGGDGLALGYLNRDDLTKERFVSSPFKEGELIYQTGDLARFHINGEVECLGRNDTQVKVRGYRIELGEIEAQLAKVDSISSQVVIVREDRPGDLRIVAYYQSKRGEISESLLKSELAKNLAPYMIPNHFVYMSEFPLTLNGKIDRKKLPPPQGTKDLEQKTFNEQTHLTATEQKLAQIWSEVLGVGQIKAEDDFFDLGGHSLGSVEVFEKISKTFKVALPLSILFEASKLSVLAKAIEDKASAPLAIDLSESGSLVSMRVSEESQKTVLFFHGVGGNILNYRSLLKFIPKNHSVFGIQSPGVQGEELFTQSLSELAILYATEIKASGIKGPFILSGGSMGGLLALEVARVLKEDGIEVEKLVMFDTFGPNYDVRRFGEMKKVSFFKRLRTSLYYRSKRLMSNLIATWAKLNGRPVPHSVRYFNVEMNNYRLMWSHRYNRYVGDIHLIRSSLEEKGWYSDPTLGWEQNIDGKVICSFVAGAAHHNFVESLHAAREFEKILGEG